MCERGCKFLKYGKSSVFSHKTWWRIISMCVTYSNQFERFFNHSFKFKTWKETCLFALRAIILQEKYYRFQIHNLTKLHYRKTIPFLIKLNIAINIEVSFLYCAAVFLNYNLTKNRFITPIRLSFFFQISSITYTAEISYSSKCAHKIIWGIVCVLLSLML